ncbi:MAG: hypothetical protein WDN50_01490 [Bradyrhizobium sp.]
MAENRGPCGSHPLRNRCSRCRPRATGAARAPRPVSGPSRSATKLAKSDGVLCPPSGVDPEIRAPTPEAGNMPVISAAGSPGGDPTIRPK